MHKARRILSISAISALVVAGTLSSAGCDRAGGERRPEVARPAKLFTVRAPGDLAPRVFPGQVQAAKRVPLSFRVGGPVVQIAVSKGQRVEQGELIARVDPRDYEVRVRELEAQLAERRAQRDQATEEYQRVRGLYQNDNASKSDFDRARAAVDVGQAQVESTEQALKAARLALSDTDLRAPFEGVVADRLVDVYQVLPAGQPVVLFQDVRGLEVVIDVPEREVAALTRAAPKAILVRFDALPVEEFSAQVKEFATESDPVTQTFPVTLRLERTPGASLLPGMTASVSWYTGNGVQDGAVVVPLASVVTDDTGETFVWRVDPGTMRVERTSVTTGRLIDGGLEVSSGLEPGDRILAAGVHFVADGQLVRPMQG